MPEELPESWSENYFNYFTEIEEHFRVARGTGMFLLSPLDWALIETWRSAGVPLEAVLKGINRAFEVWRAKKVKRRLINSVAYCAQSVMEAAAQAPQRANTPVSADGASPFTADELQAYFKAIADTLRSRTEPALLQVADSLDTILKDLGRHFGNLEALEQHLSILEEKAVAVIRTSQDDESLLAIRHSLEAELRPYRGKMEAAQIAMLERRYFDTALLAKANLPRLSLFYVR